MLSKMTIENFSKKVASIEPAPGGGSVSAMAGAMGASLLAKVCALTVGKKKYADAAAELSDVMDKLQGHEKFFIKAIDDDTTEFNKVMAGYKMPKSTEEEQKARDAAIQAALKGAADVPFSVVNECAAVLELGKSVAAKGYTGALTDAMVGAYMALCASRGAALNARINLKDINDVIFKARMEAGLAAAEAKIISAVDVIISSAQGRIGGA